MMPTTIRVYISLSILLFASGCGAPFNVEDRQRGQVLVCHRGEKTLNVSTADFHRHQEHGDAAGPCPEEQG